jgi:hypothetical protein
MATGSLGELHVVQHGEPSSKVSRRGAYCLPVPTALGWAGLAQRCLLAARDTALVATRRQSRARITVGVTGVQQHGHICEKGKQ